MVRSRYVTQFRIRFQSVLCFWAKYASLDTFWSPSVDWTKTLSGVYLREFCFDLRDSFSDYRCLCSHTRLHSHLDTSVHAHTHPAHTHSLLPHHGSHPLTHTDIQTFCSLRTCVKPLIPLCRVVPLRSFLHKLLLTGPKRCQVMSLMAATTETSPKMLLKTADQYLVWKSRVSDACWAATHRDPFAVDDTDCKRGLDAYIAAQETRVKAAKGDAPEGPQDWVGKCWLIITSSLHDDLYRKVSHVNRGSIHLCSLKSIMVLCSTKSMAQQMQKDCKQAQVSQETRGRRRTRCNLPPRSASGLQST